MFGSLEFVYLPSRQVAADITHYTEVLGGELVFAIEAFGTRVAMVRLNRERPALLLAEHLEGDRPILLYRVEKLGRAIEELAGRGVSLGDRFEMPYGMGIEIVGPGPQRIAIFEMTRPEAEQRLRGRRDFDLPPMRERRRSAG